MHEESLTSDAAARAGSSRVPAQADINVAPAFDAKAASAELLELAAVERVICVDDWYAEKEDDGENVLAALAEGALLPSDWEQIAKVIPGVALLRDPSAPLELLQDEVRDRWVSLDEGGREAIRQIVDDRLGPEGLGFPGKRTNRPLPAYVISSLAPGSF
ncbi:hypothetical protein [Streptomyces sp. I6]|uniref:hypothetical protein n=1 Tax=Streptomyces sp. I6 TaxID=2483113 RepID=UPI0011CE3BE9|nr:hypothetical protein [Streptomyces sp. I6]